MKEVTNWISYEDMLARKEEKKCFCRGTIGAFLGAVIGGVVWAVVMAMGYFLSIIGLLIAFLVDKGYALFGGKPCRAKVAVLVVCIILSIVIGIVGGYSALFGQVYDEAAGNLTYLESITMTKSEFILDCWLGSDLWSDAEFTSEFFTNAGMSAIFAALGCYGVIRSAHRVAKPKSVTNEQE